MKTFNILFKSSSLIEPALAADDKFDLTPRDNFAGLGDLTIQGIVSGLISLAFLVVVLVFFAMIVIGGLKWITADGDEKAVGAARSQITNALIGLVIVFAAWAILRLIGYIFGVDIFQLSLPTFS
jgi:hypothetical protein